MCSSDLASAAEALLTETERARRFGFNASELDRVRTNYLRSLEQRYTERDKSNSAGFAESYVSAALTREPVIGITKELELGNALAPTITLDEVNAVARATLGDSNRVILVAAPAQPDTRLPTEGELLAVFAKARGTTVAAYVDSTSDAPLIREMPAPGRIVSEQKLPETGILEWRLSNGARMLVKQTDFKADEVLFAEIGRAHV